MTRLSVQIDEVSEEGLEVSLSEAPSVFGFEGGEVAWRGPVVWTGTLQVFGGEVLCRGKAEARVALPCSRCLREVSLGLEVETVFTFAPETTPESEEEEVEVGSEEPDLYTYRDGRLNLRDPIRDYLLMSIPMQPLCRDDCKGLCAQCGADLNEGPCRCAEKALDPRWEALAGLRGSLKPERG